MWSDLETPPAQRTPEQQRNLAAEYRSLSPLLDPTRRRIAQLQKEVSQLGIATAMMIGERPGVPRPSTFVGERGSFMSKGEKVYADVPPVLGPLASGQPANRLGLAQWLVSDDNPLTARVTVNRDWETIFGHGIVETMEDYGSQGEAPTHPELLDWLATEFMRQGWSLKAVRRLIVT